MITAVLHGSYERALSQVQEGKAQAYEVRIDLFPSFDIAAIAAIRNAATVPVIFTLGNQLHHLESLLPFKPDYVDIQWDKVPDIPLGKVKLIASYHNYTATPQDLAAILTEMRRAPAAVYKIATTAHSSLDALRMLSFVQQSDVPIVGVSMGEAGRLSRLLSLSVGNYFTYLVHERGVAPGELLIDEWPPIGKETAIYGLIGHPVTQSLSHITHNAVFARCGIDAYYVKIAIEPSEFSEALPLLKTLPIQGLSVTMPFKERIGPLPTNTVVKKRGEWELLSTDGIGALNALLKHTSVQGKEIAILGTGGAAKSIAREAAKRGGSVTLYSRSALRGRPLEELGPYDILINATPVGMDGKSMPLPIEKLLPHTHVMDIITTPIRTPLISEALKQGCHIIYGYEMFAQQAAEQFERWFSGSIDRSIAIRECENPFLSSLQ